MISLPSNKALLEKNVRKDLKVRKTEIEIDPGEEEEKKSFQEEVNQNSENV